MRVLSFLCVLLWLVAGWPMVSSAAVINGTLKSINPDSRTMEIELSNGTTKSFELPDSVRFFNLSKAARIDALEEGQSVTVTTNKDNRVTDVRIKKASSSKPKSSARSVSGGNSSNGWTQYGGPNRDNRSPETGLARSWAPSGPKLLGTAKDLGVGYSSVSLADGKVLTMGSRGTDEYVICLNENSLEEEWSTRIGRTRPDNQGAGPRGTPTIDGNLVYALGANGDLACLKLNSGESVWSGNILSEFGASNIVWGISESPLVDGDKLIVTPGGRGAAMVALNKTSGKTLWKSEVPGNPQTGYSSAIIVETGGFGST